MTNAVDVALDPYGPVTMMAQSGAKGNIQQISQMSGMRGLMADPSGRHHRAADSLVSFRDGLTVLEYFLSTHGARKGLADTAIRTADSGYLTRRLIDVSQNVIVYDEDCGTEGGIWIEDLTDPSAARTALDQLVGRYLAAEVVDPKHRRGRGRCADDGRSSTRRSATRSPSAEVAARVHVRSPLTCEARHGICQTLLRLAPGHAAHWCEIGDAVGIVAAQSIGEPGTQLTMRTFHTGGVARRATSRSGLPRVEELFEAARARRARRS